MNYITWLVFLFRKLITRITPSIPSNFGFRHSFPELDDGEELPVSFTRLYFLGVHEKGKDSTLLMVDIGEYTGHLYGNY